MVESIKTWVVTDSLAKLIALKKQQHRVIGRLNIPILSKPYLKVKNKAVVELEVGNGSDAIRDCFLRNSHIPAHQY